MSRTFVWRGERSPCENTKKSPFGVAFLPPVCRIFAWRRLFASCLSYLCLAGRKVATRKPAKITIWRVFAWRPFAPPDKDTTNRGENAKGRHAKTRQMVTFSCFYKATFRPATRKYATFHALRFWLLFVVSLPDEAKGRPENTIIRHGTNQPP